MQNIPVPNLVGYWAFWPYGNTACGGEITGAWIRGRDAKLIVETKGFGQGQVFCPIAVKEASSGKETKARLEAAEALLNKELKTSRVQFEERVREILPELKDL